MNILTSYDEDEGESTAARPPRSRKHRLFIAAITLIVVTASIIYILERRGVDVSGALSTARTSSEDAATTAAVKTALALSSKVSAFAIDVDTSSGVVRLDGVVPSESMRELAIGIAADTAGVASVEDFLRVEPTARPSPEVEKLKARIADLEIRVELDSRLRESPLPVDDSVHWSVDERAVTFTGQAESFEAKSAAERIARSIDNVANVVNEIEVAGRTSSKLDAPTELSRQIRFELYTTGAFRLEEIQVYSEDGVVTLAGQVRSQAEKLLAERIVRDVDGVEDVVNELDVLAVFSRASSSEDSRRVLRRIAALVGGMR